MLNLNKILIFFAYLLASNVYGMHYDDVPNLIDLAGRVLGRYCTSIEELPIPEECHRYLGLIELEENIYPDCQETSGGKVIDNKLYLNISDFNLYHGVSYKLLMNKIFYNFYSPTSFEKLIKEKESYKLDFVLAVVTTELNGEYKRAYYSANKLIKYLNKGYPFPEYENITVKPTIKHIKYYAISSVHQTKAVFLATTYKEIDFFNSLPDSDEFEYAELDSFSNTKENEFLKYFLMANKRNAYAQFYIGHIYEVNGDINLAKRYYILAANQDFDRAQYNLACIYHKENNVAKAKHYYFPAANKGHLRAQLTLADIYNKENNITEAKYYYKLAADQGSLEGQEKLHLLN